MKKIKLEKKGNSKFEWECNIMWSPIVHGYNWDVDSFSTIQVDMVPTSFQFQ